MAVLPAQNEAYADFIFQYSQNTHGEQEYTSNDFFEIIDEIYAVVYISRE